MKSTCLNIVGLSAKALKALSSDKEIMVRIAHDIETRSIEPNMT
jgi:hypothetical protein